MKRKFFFMLAIFSISACTIAQVNNNTKSNSESNSNQGNRSYTAFDNSVFTIGDSIIIGIPRGYFSSNRYFYNIKEPKVQGGTVYYERANTNISFKKYLIKKFYSDIDGEKFSKGTPIIEVGKKGFLGVSYYIDIESALKDGEIISSLEPFNNKNILQINDSIAIINKIYLSGLSAKSFSNEYLYRLRNPTYTKVQNDEFDLNNALSSAQKEIEKSLLNFSNETTYYIETELNIGNYDFSTSTFPIEKWNRDFRLLKLTLNPNTPELFSIFGNLDAIKNIPVNPHLANSFIKRRKDSYGNINRTMYAKVYFNFVKIPKENLIQSAYTNNEYHYYVFAKISKVDFFDSEHCLYNFLGSIEVK